MNVAPPNQDNVTNTDYSENKSGTYAEVLKGLRHTNNNPVEPTEDLRALLISQSQKMEKLLEQISSLVELMAALVSKLIK